MPTPTHPNPRAGATILLVSLSLAVTGLCPASSSSGDQDPKALLQAGIEAANHGDDDKAITDFTQASRLDPKDPVGYINCGWAYEREGDYDRAISDFNKAVQLELKSAGGYAGLAWIYATCPEAGYRNGAEAVEDATFACKYSDWKDPKAVEALAAACAEAGDFNHAVKYEKKYLATPGLSTKDTAAAQRRLALYQAHQPYHEEPKM